MRNAIQASAELMTASCGIKKYSNNFSMKIQSKLTFRSMNYLRIKDQ